MSLKRDDACARLAELGVVMRPFFWPMHQQPVFRKMGLFADERYPMAEHMSHAWTLFAEWTCAYG
jgi:perosamine synthetase